MSIESIFVDIAIRVPSLPDRGGDVIGKNLSIRPGGGFNLVAAVARQGTQCVYAGTLGAGPYGALVAESLSREGIAVLAAPSAGDSGACVTLIEPDGERTFITVPGVESCR